MKSHSKDYIPTREEIKAVEQDMRLSKALRTELPADALMRLCEYIERQTTNGPSRTELFGLMQEWAKSKR